MNDKQRLFITEYLKDKNATQAAIRAGYSERTAYSQGQRLLKKAEIKREIDKLLEGIREDNVAEAKEIEEFLTSIIRGETVEQTLIGRGGGEQDITTIEVTMKDRIKAAELLGKRYSLWTDKVETNNNVVIINDDIN